LLPTERFVARLCRSIALVLVVGAAFLSTPAHAGEVLYKNGYSEFIADPEEIGEIRLRVGFKTLLLFPSDEKIVRIEVGIRGSVLEIKYGVNWVTLRPSEEHLATNLHVATDKGRVYSFDLTEGDKKNSHRKMVILRPDMDLDQDGGPALSQPQTAPGAPAAATALPNTAKAGPQGPSTVKTNAGRTVSVDDLGLDGPVTPTVGPQGRTVPGMETIRKLDNNYDIKNGSPKLFVVDKCYNDGERTFVRFKSRLNEAPLFYRVNAQEKREILTYRLEPGQDPRDPDLFVIPRLFDKATVKVGDAESHITWNATK